MARSKPRRRHTTPKSKLPSAKQLTFAKPIGLPRLSSLPSVILRGYEDRRTNWPDLYRPAFALPRSAARLVVRNVNHEREPNPYNAADAYNRFNSSVPTRVAFEVPNRVALCVRRSRRREVLFALKRTGKGSHSPKRLNAYSSVGC